MSGESDHDRNNPGALERFHVFQSYGWADEAELAQRLKKDLESQGYRVWLDLEQLQGKKDWSEVIEGAIRASGVLIALLTPHAVRVAIDPENGKRTDSVCLNEILLAHKLGKPIIPVIVLPCKPPFLMNIYKQVSL